MPHWKKAFNPDYLGAYSIENGRDLILTIKSVAVETVTGDKGRKEECLVAHFAENAKPMILNKTNCKTISKIYKNPDTDSWAGKKIQLYATTTSFAGDVVDCLRIRDSIPKDATPSTIKCEICGNFIQPANGMEADAVAAYTQMNYGKKLCAACARKEKIAKENNEHENN